MPPVIQVEHLSKHYRLGLIGGGTRREDLHRWWAKRGRLEARRVARLAHRSWWQSRLGQDVLSLP